jgi:hypothetical protein
MLKYKQKKLLLFMYKAPEGNKHLKHFFLIYNPIPTLNLGKVAHPK